MLALLVDWGYRADGIPVRLFGAWTALPAGPAMLAAKTGSRILPVTVRRQPDDTFTVSWSQPIEVVVRPTPPSSSARPRRSPTRSQVTIGAGAGAVVQLQADLAGDRGGGRRPGAAGGADAGRQRRTPGRGPPSRSRPDREGS